MKTSKSLFFLLIFGLFIFSCSKENDNEVELDKKIIIPLYQGTSGFGSNPEIKLISTPLINFNKNDYVNIDSAYLMISGLTITNSSSITTYSDTIKIELYDLTNQRVIENSSILSSYIPKESYVKSPDFFNSLPDSGINIALQVTNNYYYPSTYTIESAILIMIRN